MIFHAPDEENDLLDYDIASPDATRIRSAGKDVLSLALIDARNHTLRWAALFEATLGGPSLKLPDDAARRDALVSPLWTLGHIGWYAEYWIGRNVQRQRGERGDTTHPKLASILPEADRWFGPGSLDASRRGELDLPDLQSLRQYLVDTMETTLELLDGVAGDDDSLYFYRLVLFHEEQCREAFAVLAQALGITTELAGLPASPAVQRDPLLFPATRWRLGSEHGGFVFDNEKWAHEVEVPEFEIDAQPVSWAQFGEFVEDGGYDEPRHWCDAGRTWLAHESRRTPRYVDQMRQGVLQQRFGNLLRLPMAQPVVHVSWFEADAWCRWAGRRLPSEVEWEVAAMQGATRGFRWGDVAEWTATTLRPYPGFVASPPDQPAPALPLAHKAVRGASFATAPSLRHPKRRGGAAPDDDSGFVGLRSCAV